MIHEVDTPRGKVIAHEHSGAGSTGDAALLLHGFLGSGADWADLAPHLFPGARTVAIDLPGHGGTTGRSETEGYSMDAAVEMILATMDSLGISAFHLVGYSLGGRTALHVALASPDRVRTLVLESAACGIRDDDERKERRQADEALAVRLETQGLEPFVDAWEALPLFASQHDLPREVFARQRAARLAGDASELARSLRGMGAGSQRWLGEDVRDLPMPLLVLSGDRDAKYCALAADLWKRVPSACGRIIEGAGHNTHLEQPELFAAALREFHRGLGERASA